MSRAALEIIHDLIPLEYALQETALNTYYRLKLHTQAGWTDKPTKNPSVRPHLRFLKTTGTTVTQNNFDTETISQSIEDKHYWVTIDNKKG